MVCRSPRLNFSPIPHLLSFFFAKSMYCIHMETSDLNFRRARVKMKWMWASTWNWEGEEGEEEAEAERDFLMVWS